MTVVASVRQSWVFFGGLCVIFVALFSKIGKDSLVQLHEQSHKTKKSENTSNMNNASEEGAAGVWIDHAITCLGLDNSTNTTTLEYPSDAEEHFAEIHSAMKQWMYYKPHCAQDYCGPWIENIWSEHFYPLANNSELLLSETFGPYIPLFIPWIDRWVEKYDQKPQHGYPVDFIDTIQRYLRPTVPYITVSQGDQGLVGKCEFKQSQYPNILVLSAGGYGHVAVPLLRQEEQWVSNRTPLENRSHLVSFVGSLSTSSIRTRMNSFMYRNFRELYSYQSTPQWREVIINTQLSLAPRGFGRTSYHLMEILQLGYVPFQIYMDSPWIPYPEMADRFMYNTHPADMVDLVRREVQGNLTGLLRKEELIQQIRESHFTFKGTIHQIELFLDGRGDLRCQELPETVRGEGGPC